MGPHQTAKKQIKSNVTVHYPAGIADSNCIHGVIAFGNGTGRAGGSNYMKTFRKWASFGFVVAVHHSGSSGSGNPHKNALDAIIAESKISESIFYNRINPNAAVSGQSQGGLGTGPAANDDRFVTMVPIAGSGRGPAKPALFLTSQSDFMKTSAKGGYNGHRGKALYVEARGTGHMNVPFHDSLLNISTTWYRCYLNGNTNACEQVTNDCSMCQSQENLATFQSKNW